MSQNAKERLFKKQTKHSVSKFFSGASLPSTKALKDFWEGLSDEIYALHKNGAGGQIVCHCISDVVDAVFEELYKKFMSKRDRFDPFSPKDFCLVALGGYGRRELCPRSDIDLMFLYSEKRVNDNFKVEAIDEIMYPIWNLGYKIGHSSRTLPEAVEDAQKDILTQTAMLDARLICGSKILFNRFEASFSNMVNRVSAQHIESLLRLKTARHKKAGWLPYVQEPNIKNGVGGLRDFQTLLWVAKLKCGARELIDLVRMKIISVSEYKILRRAYSFLLRVRNGMHYRAKRENDLLDLELQPKIAYSLGYRKRNEVERVEAFMRDAYYCMREIDSSSKAARKRMKIPLPDDIEETLGIRPNVSFKVRYIEGFILKKGFIYAHSSKIFKRDPRLLITLFRHCQKYGVIPSDELEIMIRDSSHLINDKVRNDAGANAEFMKIIRSQWDVYPILYKMHFLNVLGAFIPEFDELTCLVQHEFYHRYTADVHTLNSIRELDKIFGSKIEDKTYGYYHAIISDTPNSTLLYLALLFHDIGKADGIRGHAEVGAEIARPILHRLGVPEEDIENIVFLIKNHFIMSRFWQTNDIESEEAIAKFAEMVGSEERLKFLYVLTFCDSKATSGELWNSYKQTLHTMLYRNTLRRLQKNEEQMLEMYETRRKKLYDAILDSGMEGASEQELAEHFQNLPRNYFMFHGSEDLILHMNLLHKYRENEKNTDTPNVPIEEWSNDPNNSLSTVTIVTRDVKGLFYKLASAFTYAGLNILGSKAISGNDGIIIDTFYVTRVGGGAVINERTRELFATAISLIFVDKKEVISSFPHKKDKNFTCSVTVEKQEDKIFLEVVAPDRIGLLYSITKKIYDCGFDINFARISAAERWGTNTFFLKAGKETPAAALKRLKKEMPDVL